MELRSCKWRQPGRAERRAVRPETEDSHSWLRRYSEIANCRRARTRHAVTVAAGAEESHSDEDATNGRRQGDEADE
jgi:hypothetical protein